MLQTRPVERCHVAPADDLASRRYCDEMWMAALDVSKHIGARFFDRRRLQKRQISPLPRHDVQGSMKAVGLGLSGQFRSCPCSGHGVNAAPRGTAAEQLS